MNVFWRTGEIRQAELDVFMACMQAHDRSARRQNISAAVLVAAGQGSDNFRQALAAALMCLGGLHGPLRQAYEFMDLSLEQQVAHLEAGKKAPGWGNAFVKGEPDAEWAAVDEGLRYLDAPLMARVDAVTTELHRRGKVLFPNPGGYTALVGRGLQVPVELLDWIFVRGRMDAWAELFLHRKE
jgi:citrate synthase